MSEQASAAEAVQQISAMENLTLAVIKFSRKHFRNTWVHHLPFTSWLYRQIFHMGVKDENKEVEFRGARFLLPTKDTSMIPSIINQDYEIAELDIFERLVGPGMTVLDVGANMGIYSVLASRGVGDGGKVFAFEPVPENIEYLKTNLKLNNAANVEVVPEAVGEKPDKSTIYLADNSVGTHKMGVVTDHPVPVSVNSIDNFVTRSGIHVDIIKVDVEGYEQRALKGAVETLKTPNLILFVEYSNQLLQKSGSKPAEVAEMLFSTFKHCYIVNERQGRLHKVSNPGEITKLDNDNLVLCNNELE